MMKKNKVEKTIHESIYRNVSLIVNARFQKSNRRINSVTLNYLKELIPRPFILNAIRISVISLQKQQTLFLGNGKINHTS